MASFGCDFEKLTVEFDNDRPSNWLVPSIKLVKEPKLLRTFRISRRRSATFLAKVFVKGILLNSATSDSRRLFLLDSCIGRAQTRCLIESTNADCRADSKHPASLCSSSTCYSCFSPAQTLTHNFSKENVVLEPLRGCGDRKYK